jgi:diguanylate cyclase (GGDEF)-like protein/PAS domain S-box-containing protein
MKMRKPRVERRDLKSGRMRSRLAQLERYHDTGDALEGAAAELRATLEDLALVEDELRRKSQALHGAESEAEEQRRRREELETILEAAPDGVCRLDRDGAVRYANPAAARMLGVGASELEGRQLIDVLAEGGNGELADADSRVRLERALGALRPGGGQWDYVDPGGREITIGYRLGLIGRDGKAVGAVVTLSDVTQRRALEQDLRRRADRDPLTGLLNRRAFERELERELALASRYRTVCAMLVLDVDDLKGINDVHGHLAGDAVLRAVAGTLRARLRSTDVAGRMGGDEFAVLLPRADEAAARTVAEQVVAAVGAHPVAPGGPRASISLGIALVKLPGLRITDVLRCADEAMYQAKTSGGGRMVVVDATLP